MANIPNSSKYKTTGGNQARRASTSHTSQARYQHSGCKSGRKTYRRQQDQQDSPVNNNGGSGIGIFWGVVLIVAGFAILIKYPVAVAGIILLWILCKK